MSLEIIKSKIEIKGSTKCYSCELWEKMCKTERTINCYKGTNALTPEEIKQGFYIENLMPFCPNCEWELIRDEEGVFRCVECNFVDKE